MPKGIPLLAVSAHSLLKLDPATAPICFSPFKSRLRTNAAVLAVYIVLVLAYRLSLATDYYVSSAIGDDSNSGRSPGAPLKSIESLLKNQLQPNDSVYLARGSYWREQLSLPASSITVAAYGFGEKPVLDCADIVTNNWRLAESFSHVYQVEVDAANSPGITWLSVWENGKRLVRAPSLDRCDNMPGTYFPSSDSVTKVTLFVHPIDTNDLASGLVEYSARQYGLDGGLHRGVTNTHIEGVWTRRNLNNNGSLIFTGIAENCLASEGSKHNVLTGPDSILRGVEARDAYYEGNAILFTANVNSANFNSITYESCIARVTSNSPPASISAFYAHANVSGLFGTITWDRCIVDGVLNGILTGSTNSIVRECVITNTAGGASISAHSYSLTVVDTILHSRGQQAVTMLQTATTTIQDCLFSGPAQFQILNLASDTKLTCIGSAFTHGWAVYNGPSPLVCNSNSFDSPLALIIPTASVYAGNSNYWASGAISQVGGEWYDAIRWESVIGEKVSTSPMTKAEALHSPPPPPPKLFVLPTSHSLKIGLDARGWGVYELWSSVDLVSWSSISQRKYDVSGWMEFTVADFQDAAHFFMVTCR